MIFEISDISWMLGLSIMFALAMVMTILTVQKVSVFFVWLTVFAGFSVWAGLIELWVLIICLILLVLIMISQLKVRGQGI